MTSTRASADQLRTLSPLAPFLAILANLGHCCQFSRLAPFSIPALLPNPVLLCKAPDGLITAAGSHAWPHPHPRFPPPPCRVRAQLVSQGQSCARLWFNSVMEKTDWADNAPSLGRSMSGVHSSEYELVGTPSADMEDA